jgi:hypothetical protein
MKLCGSSHILLSKGSDDILYRFNVVNMNEFLIKFES